METLNIHEVRELFHNKNGKPIHPCTIRRWIKKGEFPDGKRIGKSLYWPKHVVLEAITQEGFQDSQTKTA